MEAPILSNVPEAPPALPETTSLIARLFNVFAAPGDVFEEVASSKIGVANWLAPGIILVLVSWLASWLIYSQETFQVQYREIGEKAVEQQIAKSKMPPEQAEQTRRMAEQIGGTGARVGMVVVPMVAAFVLPFWWGLILYLVGTKIFKGSFDYMKAVEVVGLAGMTSVLEKVVTTLLVFQTGHVMATTTPALFVKNFDMQNTAHAFLALLNVFTFWVLAVRAMGLARLSNVSFAKAAAWVFGIWMTYTGALFALGQLAQRIFRK
jgi:hypothetical protein